MDLKNVYVEVDPSGRAVCYKCKNKIQKGSWRMVDSFFNSFGHNEERKYHFICGYKEVQICKKEIKRIEKDLLESSPLEIFVAMGRKK